MEEAGLLRAQFLRYLRLLGIEKQKASFEYLKEILKAHVSRIPFENISKLYFYEHKNLRELIDFELYLDGIEKYGFGGTCYANNFYFNQVFNWLGFDIKLCGADMKDPDVHLVNIVNVDDREYLIDTGYAAPFSEPIPLDLSDDYFIQLGEDRFIIKPKNAYKRSQLELYRNGNLIHGYSVNPRARKIDEFQQVIKDSFKEDSMFMNALLLARFVSGKFILIHNLSLRELSGKLTKTHSFHSKEQLSSAINKYFNIPESIVLESIRNLEMQKNAWD